MAVAVLDLMLPGIDGSGVVHQLRADPATAGATVMVVSAHGGDAARPAALAAGADAFLVKPFAIGDLMGRLRNLG